jgi:hypothetical protein
MQTSLRNLLILVTAIFALWMIVQSSTSSGQAPPVTVRWEYNVLNNDLREFVFNQQGQQGWELVTISENQPNTGYIAVFKRPAQ